MVMIIDVKAQSVQAVKNLAQQMINFSGVSRAILYTCVLGGWCWGRTTLKYKEAGTCERCKTRDNGFLKLGVG